ncbi:MAG TPA: dihydrofolate reductase [Xanthobacteraceae bacterium]|jgi:dihydrofolate reductase
MPRIALVLIAAVADNDVIGQGGRLPWRLKSEMQQFRTLTWGQPLVVGRKTYLSFSRQPLPGRTNIVVSRDPDFAAAGAVVTSSLAAALETARGDALRRGVATIVVAGGADIYAQTIADADRMVVTRVHLRPDGDVKFPAIDPAVWKEVQRTDCGAGPDDDAPYSVHRYERIRPT